MAALKAGETYGRNQETWFDDADSIITLDQDNVPGEFQALPSQLYLWGTRFAQAHADWLNAKGRLDRVEAETNLYVREDYSTRAKKGTEALYESEVQSHPSYLKARADVVEAEYVLNRVRSVLDALRTKKDALVTIGATQRAEMGA